MPSLSWEAMRLLALLVVFTPIVVVNLRSGILHNWSAAVVLVVGLALGLIREGPAEAPWLFWIIGAVVWFGIFCFVRGAPGGVIKIAIAFLPWFHDPQDYLAFVTIAMFVAAATAYLLRRKFVPIGPGMMVAGLGLFTFAAVG